MKPRESAIRTELTISCLALIVYLAAGPLTAQDVLPFPDPPMGGKVGPTMQESVHKWREAPSRLPEDAPNILIVMLDDAGFGQPDTFGGEIHTPALQRVQEMGLTYNAFHVTAVCSPTRAASPGSLVSIFASWRRAYGPSCVGAGPTGRVTRSSVSSRWSWTKLRARSESTGETSR